MISSATLLVAGTCNLACTYCYQIRRSLPAQMSWRTALAALELVVQGGHSAIEVELSGGEPLLAPALVRRIVRRLAAARKAGTQVTILLTTNGTLIDRDLCRFLAVHEVDLNLSLDGTRGAQSHRGDGTFETLDRLLGHLGRAHGEYLRSHVRIGMTVTAATVADLAEGVRYLLGRGVARIRVGPRVTPDPDWRPDLKELLGTQLLEVADASVDHWRRTGAIPVDLLAGAPQHGRAQPEGDQVCGAAFGGSICVDTGGRIWGCPLFASTLQALPFLAQEASKLLDMGSIGDPDLSATLARRAEPQPLPRAFTHKNEKRSTYGQCAECSFAADCFVCPAAICLSSANADPDEIPALYCAFNQAAAPARRRFDERTGGAASAAWLASVRQALQVLGDSMTAAVSPGAAHRAR